MAWLDGQKSNGGVAGRLAERTLGVLGGRKSAGLEHGALLEEKQLAERTLAMLDGKKSNGGVAGRAGVNWLSARWECWADGRVLE